MPKFEVDIPHALLPADVRDRLARATSKLERDYGATCTWASERELTVTRKGLNAKLAIEESRVHVDLELGLLMSAMAGPIRAGITKRLEELLGPSPAAG